MPYGGLGADDIAACRRMSELIRSSRYCVALTGAGISTESGIPDFRSPGTGLWSKVDPMELLSATAFELRPEKFYEFIEGLVETFSRAQPNAAHTALAKLEHMGYIRVVITQNIDGLHQKAGSLNVLEVHGSARSCTCTGCGRRFSTEEALRAAHDAEVQPRCESCGFPLKPDIVLFEDPMPEDFVAAQHEVLESDLLVIIGSSLEVAPVCYLPSIAKRLVIVNLRPTPYDWRAEVVVRQRAAAAMQAILEFIVEKPEERCR